MKKESLEWVKKAYQTEAECITEMLSYLDEEEFSKAIDILINAERIGTTGKNNKNIKKRYDVGSVSEFDFISSNVSVQNAIPNVIEAQNSVVLALWQLKALLGIDLQKNIDVLGSLADYEAQMNYAYSIDQLDLSNNSSLKQLGIQEDMLASALKISKLANVPTLSINAAYLYTALGNDGSFFQAKAWNPYSYAGVQLNIPIFAGGQRRAAIKQVFFIS